MARLADTSGDLIAAANSCFRGLGLGDLLDHGTDAATALRGGRAMLTLGLQPHRRFRRRPRWMRNIPSCWPPMPRPLIPTPCFIPARWRRSSICCPTDYAVGIATNKPEGLAETLMRSLGVRDAFGSLIGADTLPVRKPDPEHHFEAVRRAGGDPARSLLVGDTATDRDTSRNAGVPSVLVTFGPGRDDVLAPGAEATIDSYDELAAVVARLIG